MFLYFLRAKKESIFGKNLCTISKIVERHRLLRQSSFLGLSRNDFRCNTKSIARSVATKQSMYFSSFKNCAGVLYYKKTLFFSWGIELFWFISQEKNSVDAVSDFFQQAAIGRDGVAIHALAQTGPAQSRQPHVAVNRR